MRILSASDAISPAFARTKLVLFTPFRWGRSWKLAATAYLTAVGKMFVPFPLLYLLVLPFFSHTLGHVFVVSIVAVALLLTAIYVVIFWLCSRLQFAFFDIVLNRGEFVAPAWRKYGAVARPWTLLKCAVGIVATMLITACGYPFVHHLLAVAAGFPAMAQDMAPGRFGPGQLPPTQMFAFMGAFYGLYFLLLLLFGSYYLVMSTATAFMLPSMALEGVSPRIAFDRMLAFIRQQPGPFFGFVGLRVGLGIAGYIALVVAYEIVLFLLLLIVGLLCALVGYLLHAVGVPMSILAVLGALVVGFFVIVVNSYILFLCLGAYFTFFEAHTLYFLGGRYPLLGDLLDRSTPPPPYLPPPTAYGWPAPYPAPPYPPPQG